MMGDVYGLAMAANAPPGWMVPSTRLWRMRLTQVAAAGPVVAAVAGIPARLPAGPRARGGRRGGRGGGRGFRLVGRAAPLPGLGVPRAGRGPDRVARRARPPGFRGAVRADAVRRDHGGTGRACFPAG